MGSHKPALYMIVLQFFLSAQTMLAKAVLLRGMSPRVFVVYRQIVATILIALVVCFSRWKNPNKTSLGLKGFCFIFLNALIGITGNHNAYYQGLKLSSSSVATAMTNLMPAITFLMASIVGFEKVNARSFRGITKIMGTVVCIGGAIIIALVKGPTLLHSQSLSSVFNFLDVHTSSGPENLQLGCLFLFLCCCFWSLWIILQVPASAACPDHLYSTLWLCFLSTILSAIFALSIDRNLDAWALNSALEIGSCLYAGLVGAFSFFLQTWCISQRGPVFSSIFSPLSTVITTVIATSFLHEELYTGSLIGAFAVIIGLYVVLWGKAKDLKGIKQELQGPNQLKEIKQELQGSNEHDHDHNHDDRRPVDIVVDDRSKETINSN